MSERRRGSDGVQCSDYKGFVNVGHLASSDDSRLGQTDEGDQAFRRLNRAKLSATILS